MRYIFPILIFLILAVQPSGSCCFYSPVSPYSLYSPVPPLYGGTQARLWGVSPLTIYPNPYAWEKNLASPVCLDTYRSKQLCTTREDHIKVHIPVQEAPSQLAACELMHHV